VPDADYLIGVEEYELAFVEDVLDDSPVDAQTVYKETIAMSERSIAAVAAKRAGEGGGGGDPVPFVGDDPPADPDDGDLWWDTDDETAVDGGSQPGPWNIDPPTAGTDIAVGGHS
jgi:hypothetical protein